MGSDKNGVAVCGIIGYVGYRRCQEILFTGPGGSRTGGTTRLGSVGVTRTDRLRPVGRKPRLPGGRIGSPFEWAVRARALNVDQSRDLAKP